MDEQARLTEASALFDRTFARTLNVWRLISSLQLYIAAGLPSARGAISNEMHQTPSELLARPDYGTAEQVKWVRESLPTYVEGATNGTIEDAKTAANAALVVFAHSALDAAIDGYCEVSAILNAADWMDFVEQREVTLREVRNREFDDLLKIAVSEYLKKLHNKSLLNKIETPHGICKPGSKELAQGYRFDAERIRRIDNLRHEIVHGEGLGSRIENAADDLDYLWKTSTYLSAMITHRYGLRLGPTAIPHCG